MKTLISIDPGVSSAYSVLEYDDCCPPKLVEFAQFKGGAEELIKRVKLVTSRYPAASIICEDFTARNNPGFSYKTKDLEPLVCIGALIALGVISRSNRDQMPAPALQYFMGGKTLQEKKTNRRLWLAENGFKVMPKDVGQPDCDDVRSSLGHAISWLRKFHKPTQDLFRKEN